MSRSVLYHAKKLEPSPCEPVIKEYAGTALGILFYWSFQGCNIPIDWFLIGSHIVTPTQVLGDKIILQIAMFKIA